MNLLLNTVMAQTAGWFGLPELIIILVILFLTILPIVALVDIIRSNFNSNDKLIWVLVVIFLPLVGSILYFIIGVKKKQ